MKKAGNTMILSAGDLANHIACRHLTYLDMAAANGILQQPDYHDPSLEIMQERGLEFEQAYLEKLREKGFLITEPGQYEPVSALQRTIDAMHAGADIIYQAVLGNGILWGRADFLQKVDKPSNLESWSYEVIDSKLAKATRAGTILQLCLYSRLVEKIQEVMPEFMHVITPEKEFTMDGNSSVKSF